MRWINLDETIKKISSMLERKNMVEEKDIEEIADRLCVSRKLVRLVAKNMGKYNGPVHDSFETLQKVYELVKQGITDKQSVAERLQISLETARRYLSMLQLKKTCLVRNRSLDLYIAKKSVHEVARELGLGTITVCNFLKKILPLSHPLAGSIVAVAYRKKRVNIRELAKELGYTVDYIERYIRTRWNILSKYISIEEKNGDKYVVYTHDRKKYGGL